MMNKLSIKKRLLVHNFLIQCFIILVFSLSLYKAIEITTIDKLQSTLKVIILDIADDILEHSYDLKRSFDEESEYKFEPLFIRLLKVNDKIEVINSQNFPDNIKKNLRNLKNLKYDTITFEIKENYIISRLKYMINDFDYVLEIATNKQRVNAELENFLYILFFIVPIILIFATIGGYFLIFKSFSPIEKLLYKLKSINAKDLSKRLDTSNNPNDEIDMLSNEINDLLQRLEISFDKISQFTSDASHELKTPLTIIRGEIEISLRKDRGKEEYTQTLQSCLDEINVIQQTVDDLLFLAKVDNERMIHDELIYLDEITLEASKELNNFANIKQVKLKPQIDEPIEITGHSKLLKIAIKNIIKNSITFSHKDSQIIIRNYLENGNKIISVQDFGIGISKKEQSKIFEKFYRTDKSRNKESGGTGLGLSICKKIVEMHNGEIDINSSENEGTTIKFIFE